MHELKKAIEAVLDSHVLYPLPLEGVVLVGEKELLALYEVYEQVKDNL